MQTVAGFSGELTIQVHWLGLGLAATWHLVCIHHKNRVNSHNDLPHHGLYGSTSCCKSD